MLNSLFKKFDSILLLDVETTGLDPRNDQIIEFGALRVRSDGGQLCTEDEESLLIRLSVGRRLPEKIRQLTGISEELLEEQGMELAIAAARISRLLDAEKPLIAAYNAQFDLCFLYYFLHAFGLAGFLRKARFLDAMTVYKDRREYPHRLQDAVNAYRLETPNTHRALDDARATLSLLKAMGAERDDLHQYINLFGYNPKYGVSGQRISSIQYAPQSYDSEKKLYEVL